MTEWKIEGVNDKTVVYLLCQISVKVGCCCNNMSV